MADKIKAMTVDEAAKKLRAMDVTISAKTFRDGIAQDGFPFGTYIKTEKSCVYFAWTRLFEKWVPEHV